MRTMKTVYSIAEAAQRSGIARRTLSRLIAEGALSVEREGRCAMIRASDLAALTTRRCPQCGREFPSRHARRVFCSPACRFAATNERRRRSKPAPKPEPVRSLDMTNERLRAALRHVRKRSD